jgi:hypothetical protein
MTTWSVVKDDTREKRWRDFFPRFPPRVALLACIALVVVSLGATVTPAQPQKPAEPPFSEQARAAALSEALRLSAAGEQLGQAAPGTAPDAAQASVSRTVTLLTTQARALLAPAGNPPHASAPAVAAPLSSASPSSPSLPAPPLPSSTAGLVAELASSGGQRLADAAKADGGMARLLAAVGTGQLLQASSLAAAVGVPAPGVPAPAQGEVPPSEPPAACPSEAAAASSSPAGGNALGATLGAALATAVRTEGAAVYGYQVALTRLGGEAAASASEQLARHEGLLSGAEALSRRHCAPVPPREAGYRLGQAFLASPAAGLAGLEAAALPVYGELVALSSGETRHWAISALLGTARQAAFWGADAGAVPGLAVDPASFPPLPPGTSGPSRAPSS